MKWLWIGAAVVGVGVAAYIGYSVGFTAGKITGFMDPLKLPNLDGPIPQIPQEPTGATSSGGSGGAYA